MIVLELLALILALTVLLVVKLMPIISVLLIGFCVVAPFIFIYYSKLPNLKMGPDQEIPIEQVTFVPRHIIKEIE